MKKPHLIALAMSAIIVLWMASGLLRSSEEEIVSTPAGEANSQILVQTQTQSAQSVQLQLKLQGYVEPNREVTIRSDIAGRVAEVLVEDGQWVEAGTLLVRLDIENRQVELEKERALLQSRQNTYERVTALGVANFQSKSAIEDAFAELKSAEASVAEIELDIRKLEIRAPFAGVVDARMVEQGGYVSANGEIARFVDNDPLIVVVPIAQQNVRQVTPGAVANVSFAIGESRQGKLSYVSSLADANTRTFRAEVAVENPSNTIPAGISAEVEIPTLQMTGHFVSPAILGLDGSGQMGIKTVDDDNRVVFHPVSIIRATTEGVWVSGLPQVAQIITVGQGFVEEGVQVRVAQVNTQANSLLSEAVSRSMAP